MNTSVLSENLDVKEGDALILQGEKELKRTVMQFFGFVDTKENAKECFKKAANIYKYNKMWIVSGDTFLRCAELAEYESEKIMFYQNAIDCFSTSCRGKSKKVYIENKIVKYINLIIDYYIETGNFRRAAVSMSDLASFYLNNFRPREASSGSLGEERVPETLIPEDAIRMAVSYYERALSCLSGKEDEYSCVKIKNILLGVYIWEENYERSIQVCSDLINSDKSFNKKELMITLCLCTCLLDIVMAKRMVSGDLVDVVTSIENNDKNGFLKAWEELGPQKENNKVLFERVLEGFNEKDNEDLC